MAVNNLACKWKNGLPIHRLLFKVTHMENWKFQEKLLSLGFLGFFVIILTLAKAQVEILTKKSRNSSRKLISLKYPVLPCHTLKTVNKQLLLLRTIFQALQLSIRGELTMKLVFSIAHTTTNGPQVWVRWRYRSAFDAK